MEKEPPVGQKPAQEEINMEKEPPMDQKTHTGGDKHRKRASCGSKSPHRRR